MQNIIKDTGTAKGRGVFAACNYKKGDLVEEAPVIPVMTYFKDIPYDLKLIMFSWKDGASALSLGYGSLYNHDNPANVRYETDYKKDVIRYIADRDINADEELTINYNADGGLTEWHDDNWFARMKIKRI